MLSTSCSGAENASMHTHTLNSAANQEEIPGGRTQPSAKHVPRGPGAATTLPAAQRALGKELECQARALLPPCMCARARCRAPGHHRHRLRGRLAKSTRRASPQNSLKSFILQDKEKVRRQTTEGEDLPESHAASSSCRLNLPHHLLFSFFTPPTRKLRGPRGGEQTCSATAIRTTQVSSHAELLLPASPPQRESHQRVPVPRFCLRTLLRLQPASGRFRGETTDAIGQGNELFVQLYFSGPDENRSGRRWREEQWISVAVETV